MQRKFVVIRTDTEECTVAIVTVESRLVTEEQFLLVTKEQFLKAIQKAVTAWVKNSDEGKKALANAADDYNIGDLALDLDTKGEILLSDWGPKDIHYWLIQEGLIGINIKIYSDMCDWKFWEFDDHLVIKDN